MVKSELLLGFTINLVPAALATVRRFDNYQHIEMSIWNAFVCVDAAQEGSGFRTRGPIMR